VPPFQASVTYQPRERKNDVVCGVHMIFPDPMSTRVAWTICAACLTLAPLTAAAQSAEPAVDNPTRLGLTGTFAFDPQGSAGLPLGWGAYVEHLVWRGLSGDVGYNSLHIGGNEGDHSRRPRGPTAELGSTIVW
jgi:hypothetical protein